MWAIVCMSLRSYLCIVYIGLINAVLYMWVVVLLKFGPHGIDERENLLQSVVPRLIPQCRSVLSTKCKYRDISSNLIIAINSLWSIGSVDQ